MGERSDFGSIFGVGRRLFRGFSAMYRLSSFQNGSLSEFLVNQEVDDGGVSSSNFHFFSGT